MNRRGRRNTAGALLIAALSCVDLRASAQEAAAEHASQLHEYFGAWFLAATPFGNGGSIPDWGVGAGLTFGVGWGRLPLLLGVDLMALFWGTSEIPAHIDLGDSVASARLRRSDNTVFFDGWLRAQPQTWFVRPYFEGVLGFKQLYTDYRLRLVDGTGATRKTTNDTGAATYGIGLGVDITLAHNDQGATAFVALGLRRLSGGNASFTRGPDAPLGNRRASFEVVTDTTIVQVGIVAALP